jgi:hypothetical protein
VRRKRAGLLLEKEIGAHAAPGEVHTPSSSSVR